MGPISYPRQLGGLSVFGPKAALQCSEAIGELVQVDVRSLQMPRASIFIEGFASMKNTSIVEGDAGAWLQAETELQVGLSHYIHPVPVGLVELFNMFFWHS
jgi:hypothetical protein